MAKCVNAYKVQLVKSKVVSSEFSMTVQSITTKFNLFSVMIYSLMNGVNWLTSEILGVFLVYCHKGWIYCRKYHQWEAWHQVRGGTQLDTTSSPGFSVP